MIVVRPSSSPYHYAVSRLMPSLDLLHHSLLPPTTIASSVLLSPYCVDRILTPHRTHPGTSYAQYICVRTGSDAIAVNSTECSGADLKLPAESVLCNDQPCPARLDAMRNYIIDPCVKRYGITQYPAFVEPGGNRLNLLCYNNCISITLRGADNNNIYDITILLHYITR